MFSVISLIATSTSVTPLKTRSGSGESGERDDPEKENIHVAVNSTKPEASKALNEVIGSYISASGLILNLESKLHWSSSWVNFILKYSAGVVKVM